MFSDAVSLFASVMCRSNCAKWKFFPCRNVNVSVFRFILNRRNLHPGLHSKLCHTEHANMTHIEPVHNWVLPQVLCEPISSGQLPECFYSHPCSSCDWISLPRLCLQTYTDITLEQRDITLFYTKKGKPK